MGVVQINRGEALYPERLENLLADEAPEVLVASGNYYLLDGKKLAFFCASAPPTEIALNCYVFAQQMRNSPACVIGGFDSEAERESLDILLESPAPVIICPTRQLESMRIPQDYRSIVEMGRLLLVSPFTEKGRPPSEASAYRNRVVAALADHILVAYAGSGDKLEKLCHEAAGWGIPLYTFSHRDNKRLLEIGAKAIYPDHAFGPKRRRGRA
jgi:predicted Rossmann fold nucleotide-binding protein DprA/Smf involved in DNA uptake